MTQHTGCPCATEGCATVVTADYVDTAPVLDLLLRRLPLCSVVASAGGTCCCAIPEALAPAAAAAAAAVGCRFLTLVGTPAALGAPLPPAASPASAAAAVGAEGCCFLALALGLLAAVLPVTGSAPAASSPAGAADEVWDCLRLRFRTVSAASPPALPLAAAGTEGLPLMLPPAGWSAAASAWDTLAASGCCC